MRSNRRIPGRRLFRFPWRTAAQVAADVDEELQLHLDLAAQELVDAGWLPEAARVEAVRRFGDLEGTRKACSALDRSKETQMKWMQMLEALGQDVRFAGRQLAKSPGFTFVIVLTLALAVGASTSIFSVVHGILLKPLPFGQSDRLLWAMALSNGEESTLSYPNFSDWRDASKTVAQAASFHPGSINLSGDSGDPERLIGMYVNAEFFSVLGIKPLAGRWFAPGEDKPGGPAVAVISEVLWERRYGRDPGLIGRSIRLNGTPFTVIGIVHRKEQFFDVAEVWIPLGFTFENLQERNSVYLGAIGRLAPGATLKEARSEAKAIGERLARQYPEANTGYSMDMEPLQTYLVGEVRTQLLVLLGAVLFVLLIACANVANLLLVRATAREGEVAIRSALGARKGRIVRQLLTESIVLAALGGGAGVALAIWMTKALVALAPAQTPRLDEVAVDGPVLLFALGITLVTGLLFGLAPTLQASRPNLTVALKEGARGSRGRASTRARNTLVVAEIALAVMLLAGAGLLLRSFARLQEVPLGFQVENVLKLHVSLPSSRYDDDAKLRAFVDGLVERLKAVPGVRSAGVTVYGLPLTGGVNVWSFTIAGRPPVPQGQEPVMRAGVATPGFFETLGIRVARGRALDARDREGATPVIVINEAAARRYFPNEEALGKRIILSPDNPDGLEIVGILRNFKQNALAQEIEPQMYLPYAQAPMPSLAVVVRTASDPAAVTAPVAAKVHELDPEIPVYAVRTMEEVLALSSAQPKFYMLLLGAFALIALLLAAVGIYGVIGYTVRQRTQEIGIRMALGASRERVLRMVVRQGLTLAALGAVAGLLGALLATRGMQSLLYEVSATDPAIYLTVAVVLVAVAAVASWLPARRAAGTEPLLALRGQGA
ncbi:MAG TPA: ABC transporter permease [Thermoanaerobaculia bacterium]|nr:ABC transporter permease [Thermoanaerobaculia bacterium]